ncbi:hypothetical protein R1flu_026997 [Riccia fluitans]|uniref:Uncharacterized protein n=1 Tax=Riccia fluitans TaxID=41844 RepID=A0ABD1XHI1_9MARC
MNAPYNHKPSAVARGNPTPSRGKAEDGSAVSRTLFTIVGPSYGYQRSRLKIPHEPGATKSCQRGDGRSIKWVQARHGGRGASDPAYPAQSGVKATSFVEASKVASPGRGYITYTFLPWFKIVSNPDRSPHHVLGRGLRGQCCHALQPGEGSGNAESQE